ncbi:MAG TPA: class I SAM-dependent methyltransferase [Solirubrobacteraceae bacterium]|jgi:predicted O-methyltransferase YrrM|nr:class I SAM-dependent methyltransferase [Solirubrobacteraceae bacterium]
MDPELEQLLERLYEEGREHDANTPDRRERMRNVEPESARMLAVLVRALRPQRMLELGTSNGYSTIWLADAARAVGGRLTSVEIESGRHAQSQQNLQRTGLREYVELRLEDAQVTLAGSADEVWDVIFLDAERAAYTSYWPELVRTLSPSGLLIVDNAISHEHELVEFRALVEREDRTMEALVPIGAGMLMVVKDAVGPVG